MKIERVAKGSAMLLALWSAPVSAHPGHHGETLASAGGLMHYLTQPDHAGAVMVVCAAILLAAAVAVRVRGALLR